MFTLITFPMMFVPFVPSAFRVVIDTFPLKKMGIEPSISFFFVMQAVQYKIKACFRQWGSDAFESTIWLAPELKNLAWRMGAVRLSTPSNRTGDCAFAIGFPCTCRTIPFLPAVERGAPKQPIYPVGVIPCPEGQQIAEGQFCLRL